MELRDGGARFMGKGVLTAVSNVNTIIAPALIGKDETQQEAIDKVRGGRGLCTWRKREKESERRRRKAGAVYMEKRSVRRRREKAGAVYEEKDSGISHSGRCLQD